MTWTQIAAGVFLCIYMLWVFWRTERQFQAGYRRALDHVEEMTRPGRRGSYTLPDALKKLREEP